jgi:FAD-linked sulfhydryl oxidase
MAAGASHFILHAIVFSPLSHFPSHLLQVHSIAAYYPEAPSAAEQAAALGLVAALAQLYPCGHCREAFAAAVEAEPPDVSSGLAFAQWACRQHNAVNAALGRPAFPCSAEALGSRWRSGCRGQGGEAQLQ